MVRLKALRIVLFLAGTLLLSSSLLGAAESIISKVSDSSGNYCHLKFPAIKGETLYWEHPVLKDPRDGDIVDFYGACNHDPLGNEEIVRQQDEYRHLLRNVPLGE